MRPAESGNGCCWPPRPTSLSPQCAGVSEILALNRGHWQIENRVHYVRDFSFDEDRCRIRAGKLPRNLARFPNAAILVVRMRGHCQHQPQARRHYAASGRVRRLAADSRPATGTEPGDSDTAPLSDSKPIESPSKPPAVKSDFGIGPG